MDEVISATWPALLFGVAVFAIVFIIRHAVEGAFPGVTSRWFWRDVALLVLPPLIGGVLVCLGRGFPYPVGFTELRSQVMFYGIPVGFASGTIYRIVKKIAEAKFGVDISEDK